MMQAIDSLKRFSLSLGVHINSGIMNLAFALMVQGGSHPRGMTSVQVTAIDSDFDTSLKIAANIFYSANTACLTPGSNFEDARYGGRVVLSAE
jgi:bacillolysin